MDIFAKMNPFTRPSSRSSAAHRPSFESSARPSSSLESNLPPLPESDGDVSSFDTQRRYLTPVPQTPKRGHVRTPSLLRSLAHHPSLSALRSKSKSKTGKKKLKQAEKAGLELARDVTASEHGVRGLKGSRSVPRDLGASGDEDG
jgi:hypothetical protein